MPRSLTIALVATLLLTLAVSSCQGCTGSQEAARVPTVSETPTVRLYLLSTIAGAIEPCGCTKDQLGGVDHLAALVNGSAAGGPARVVLGAGPQLFLDPQLEPDKRTQDTFKAQAMADAFKDLGLRAWAPGANDWAAGDEKLRELVAASGASLLAANLEHPAVAGSVLITAGGLRIGVFGISEPRGPGGALPEGVAAKGESVAALARAEVDALKRQGARLLVGLVSMQRGAALRIADEIPELHVLLLGKPMSAGDLNDSQPTPQRIGQTLVVETANHAQTVAVVDIHAPAEGTGLLELGDAGGMEQASEIATLSARIRELEHRINGWESGGKVDPADLAARKEDLKEALARRDALQRSPAPPQGAFFRFTAVEVREQLGEDKAVGARLSAYYQRVNEHNKVAFADRVPPPVGEGEARYVGIEECSNCHLEEREVWDKTSHALAYKTLVDDHKEFNLDCVGCHVTGYSKPGGSTVTHNELLRSVQCEECHGPGSAHVAAPEEPGRIILKPDPQSCVDQCHHPPHVEGFDPVAKMDLVLGPGHGK